MKKYVITERIGRQITIQNSQYPWFAKLINCCKILDLRG